jgi:hypothetical protein
MEIFDLKQWYKVISFPFEEVPCIISAFCGLDNDPERSKKEPRTSNSKPSAGV